MGDTSTDRLEAIPWAASIIKDTKWIRAHTPSRLPKASGEDSFFAETLKTDRTMRSCLTLRPVEEHDDDQAYKEVLCIVELGDALNGFPRTIHGGMAATLLDEVCGVLIVLNSERKTERAKTNGPTDHYMTACEFRGGRRDVQETNSYTWRNIVHCQGRAARWP
jgi:thioesterase superfamily protein 4